MPDPTHEEIKQDLLTNPRYAALFAPYHPDAVARFASSYASHKFNWQWRGPQAEFDQTEALTQLSEAAYSRLWDIQRKKLLDLQCRWRAGELTHPGLGCTHDFGAYDAAIENCPVLPPISPDELAMYCDFVRQSQDFDNDVLDAYRTEDFGLPRNWQDYDELRLHAQEEAADLPDDQRQADDPPAWYEFHNLRTGHARLLVLPDLRGPLEQPYLQAYYAHHRAEHAARPASPPPADARPTFLTSTQEAALQHALLHQFETPKLRRQHAAYVAEQAREAAEIQPAQGKVVLTKPDAGVAWGALYWQYFEDIDKVTPAATPLSLERQLYRETRTAGGPVLEKIGPSTPLKIGDALVVRLVLRTDRALEYVHLKDQRAAGLEPIAQTSGYRYQNGLGYYESPRDAATNFFLSEVPRGTHVFEYRLRAAQAGDFSGGLSEVQCLYAPEFGAHSAGVRLRVAP